MNDRQNRYHQQSDKMIWHYVTGEVTLVFYFQMRPCISIRGCVRPWVGKSRFCKKRVKWRILCAEMINKAYKVMNNVKTAL